MKISIENRKGSYRSGIDSDGKPWKTKLWFPYGYLINAIGSDNENLDCFIGNHKDSKKVYVIHQKNIKTGKYDEDKVMLGWLTQTQAIKDYLKNYNRSDMFMGCTKMSMDDFKVKGFTKKPGMIKAHVKAHTRTVNGKRVLVRAHEDSRKKKEILVYKTDPTEVGKFLKRYPKIEPAMKPFISGGLMSGYKRFLKYKDKNQNFGGYAETVDSPTFGKKTFHKFDWGPVSGWAEVFQCLYYGKVKSGMSKAHIKMHTRRLKSGKITTVRAHEDSRKKKIAGSEKFGTGTIIKVATSPKIKRFWGLEHLNYYVGNNVKDNIPPNHTVIATEIYKRKIPKKGDLWRISIIQNEEGQRYSFAEVKVEQGGNFERIDIYFEEVRDVESIAPVNNYADKMWNRYKVSPVSKSQIKAHTRRSKKTGKIMHVRAHSDIRTREDIIYEQ